MSNTWSKREASFYINKAMKGIESHQSFDDDSTHNSVRLRLNKWPRNPIPAQTYVKFSYEDQNTYQSPAKRGTYDGFRVNNFISRDFSR